MKRSAVVLLLAIGLVVFGRLSPIGSHNSQACMDDSGDSGDDSDDGDDS